MNKDTLLIILLIIVVILAALIVVGVILSFRAAKANKVLVEKLEESSARAVREARAKTEFVAHMSHDIRVPMNAINCATELLLKEDLPPVSRSYLGILKNSSASLAELVNGILDFSKMDAGSLSLIENDYSFYDVIDDVESFTASKLSTKEVTFTVDVEENVPKNLYGDEVRIKQILINLLNNAAKYTTKGNISLKILAENFTDKTVDIKISVKDTGCGMPPTSKEKLKELFESKDGIKHLFSEGTGLGLTMVNRLSQMMNGHVSFESELGKGSEFTVTFMQKLSENTEPAANPEITKGLAQGVVIWEDTPEYLENLSAVLGRLKVPVKVIGNESELSGVISASKIDYVITTEKHFNEVVDVINQTGISCVPVKLVEMDEPADTSFDGNFATVKRPVDIFKVQNVLRSREFRDMHTAGHSGKLMAPDAHVLVVDDNKVNLKVAKSLLDTFSINTVTAESGSEAIELIRKGTKFDLIFMDHMMPGMDGIEAATRIWEIEGNNRTPVIALTANAGGEVEKLFIDAGMNDFIPKPIVMKHLNFVLQKWLPKSKQIFSESGTEETKALVRMSDVSFQPEWGLSKVWNDKKIFFDILHVFLNKQTELTETIGEKENPHEAENALNELKQLSLSAGATKLPEMIAELLQTLKSLDNASFKIKFQAVKSETEKTAEEIKKYLDKEEPEDNLTF